MLENIKPRVYCTCKGWQSGAYFGLFKAGETKTGGIQFVHHPCAKPSEPVWRNWLTQCNICLGLFSSPWSHVCKACHREESPGAPFKGWAWARHLEGF